MSSSRRSRSISASSRSTPPPPPLQPNSLNDTTLCFNPRGVKQPLYRPAALRRNNSTTWELQLQVPSPPLSPSVSSGDLRSSWLAGLAAAAPWSPISVDKEPARTEAGPVRGVVMRTSQWVPDTEATVCAESDCRISFGLIDRKHHCRSCGLIFCSTHSSRYTLLWNTTDESVPSTPTGTPLATPYVTPRSSSLDIPSLSSSTSPASSIHSNSVDSSSPPRAPSQAVSCRVCDTCFFSPSASTTLPALHIPSYAAPVRPLNLRSPNSFTRSPLGSPGPSPPFEATDYTSHSSAGSSNGRVMSRSRHGSTMSASTSPSNDSASTAPTSVDSSHIRKDGQVGAPESTHLSDDEMSLGEEAKGGPATAFGTPWAWNSWATF